MFQQRTFRRMGAMLSALGDRSISLPRKGKGVYRLAAREHLLGVEFPSAGLDAGGSEQNHPNQKRCKDFGACLQPAKGQAGAECPPSRHAANVSVDGVWHCT